MHLGLEIEMTSISFDLFTAWGPKKGISFRSESLITGFRVAIERFHGHMTWAWFWAWLILVVYS